jgi:hypothetical protein
MTKHSVTSVIRMAQAVAERNVQLPEGKNDTAVSKAIESVLQMIETKSGNGPEMQKLALLVRRCI